jgi:hypothetical protein
MILVLAWMLFFVLCFARARRFVRAALGAAVCFGAATVFGCELLSLFGGYSTPWLVLYWLALGGAAAVCLRGSLREGLAALRAWRPGRPPWYAVVGLAVVGLCALAALLAALLYPPMNYDSLTYHMPRVFFWLKNASVHNYPTAENRQLFIGPLTEFFILQVQALCMGSDRLANTVQWFAYLGSIAAVYGVAEELGAGPRGRWLAAVLAATTPMAVLQASTTQSDMELTFWCLVVAHGVVAYRRTPPEGTRGRALWAMVAGGAAGLAALTKINAVSALIPFALLALALMLRRRAWRDMRVAIPVALACVVWISGGFFTRNALDNRGDITGHGDVITRLELSSSADEGSTPSAGDATESSPSPGRLKTYALVVVKAVAGSLGGTPFNTVNNGIDAVVEAFAERLGVPLNLRRISEYTFSATMQGDVQSHDTRTNSLQTGASYAVILVFLGGAVLGKTKKARRFLGAYALATAVAYGIMILSLAWTTSLPRYLLPALLISYGLVPLAFRGRRWLRKLACAGLACAALIAVPAMLFNHFQPLVYWPRFSVRAVQEAVGGGVGYEDLRAYSMGVDPDAFRTMLRQADRADGGPLRVGIDQSARKSAAIYPVLYAYRSDAYEVRYIHSRYPRGVEEPAFVPQIVFATARNVETAPADLDYQGAHYALAAAEPAAAGALCLYMPDDASR